jgi:glycosyltransferase involved in cell wall biosynthesis
VLGEVSDLSLALDGSAAGICPVRMGAGMQNKILDYLAHGLPVVSSPIGIAGIGAQAGVHLLVADTPDDWFSQSVSVLRAGEGVHAMAKRGRDWVLRNHDWLNCTSPLVQRLLEVVAARHQRRDDGSKRLMT